MNGLPTTAGIDFEPETTASVDFQPEDGINFQPESSIDTAPKMAQSGAEMKSRIARNPALANPGAQQQSFEDYLAQHPRPSDVTAAKLAPTATTPEQQEQLGKFIAAKRAPELPVGSVAGDAWTAAWTPPKPLNDIIQLGRDIQENNAQTTENIRQVAIKHGLDPDKFAPKMGLPEQVLRGTGNAIVDLATTFTSPAGLATLGIGELPAAAQKALSIGFAGQMLSQAPGTAQELLAEIAKPADQRDYKKIAQLTVSGAGQLGMGAMATAHGTQTKLDAELEKFHSGIENAQLETPGFMPQFSPNAANWYAPTPPAQRPLANTGYRAPGIPGAADVPFPPSDYEVMKKEAANAADRVTAAVSSNERPPISGYDARISGAAHGLPAVGYTYDPQTDHFHSEPIAQPSTETEVPNASEIPSPEGVSQPEVRPPVGETPPLRQQGEAPAARTEPPAVPPEQPAQQPQVPVNVVTEPRALGEHAGVTFDAPWQPVPEEPPLLQFTWREKDVPKDSPLYGVTFYTPADATPEQVMEAAKAKAKAFGVQDYKPPTPQPAEPAAPQPTPIATPPAMAPVAEAVPNKDQAWFVPWADGRARAWFKTKDAATRFYQQKLAENDVDSTPQIGWPDPGVKYADEKYGALPVWKVSYTDLEDRVAKRPFFKKTVYSEGATKKEAVERVQKYHGNSSRYGEFRASKAPEGTKADTWFKAEQRQPEPATQEQRVAVLKVEAAKTEAKSSALVPKKVSALTGKTPKVKKEMPLDFGLAMDRADSIIGGDPTMLDYYAVHQDQIRDAVKTLENHIGTKFERPKNAAQLKAMKDFLNRNIDVASEVVQPKQIEPAAQVLAPKAKIPPNVAFVKVVNYDGVTQGYVTVPYDGTPEGAVAALAKAQQHASDNFAWKDEYYNTESQNGATDESGKLKWVISPNRLHLAEPTTSEARYILGDLSARQKPVAELPPARAEAGSAAGSRVPPESSGAGPQPVGGALESENESQLIEQGDTALYQDPSRPDRPPVKVTIRSIRQLPNDAEPMAEFDYFGNKRVPVSKLSLFDKSQAFKMRQLTEKNKAADISTRTKPSALVPKKVSALTGKAARPESGIVFTDDAGNYISKEKDGTYKVWQAGGTVAKLAGTIGFKGAEGFAKAKERLSRIQNPESRIAGWQQHYDKSNDDFYKKDILRKVADNSNSPAELADALARLKAIATQGPYKGEVANAIALNRRASESTRSEAKAYYDELFAPESKPALTPMMQQYHRIKEQLVKEGHDALLAFRLGDFYEFFFDDAKTAAEKLKIALTNRNGVPMAGIPYHAAQNYFGKLVSAGHKVAVVDTESGAKAEPGKPVERKVTEIMEPKPVEQPVAKEPWEMTRAEIHNGTFDVKGGSAAGEHTLNLEIAHRAAIRKALAEGKPVPPEVLADYPELAKTGGEGVKGSELKIGDPIKIMGVDSVLADTHTEDGMRYEIFNAAKLSEPRAAIRATDIDTGNVTTLKQYPTYADAEADWNKVVKRPQWQQTKGGRSVLGGDIALENTKEDAVVAAMKAAPSYPKLLAAYNSFRRSLHGKSYNPSVIETRPWEMLDSSSGVMNAGSARAKTLRSLETAVFKESGLPRKAASTRFRGGTGVDWDEVKPPKPPEGGQLSPKELVELNELRLIAQIRTLGVINKARMTELEAWQKRTVGPVEIARTDDESVADHLVNEQVNYRSYKKVGGEYVVYSERGYDEGGQPVPEKPVEPTAPSGEAKFSVNPAEPSGEERWLKYGANREEQSARLVEQVVRPAMLRRSGNEAYAKPDSVIAVVPDLPLDTESHFGGIEAFEKLFGKRIIFYRDNINSGEFGGLSHSSFPDVTFVNSRDAKPWVRLAAHELFHQLRFERPDLYDSIVSELRDEIRSPNPREVQAYLKAGYQPGEIIDEQMADFLADRFTEPEFWQRFAEKDPSLFERAARTFVDWMNSVLKWLNENKYGASKFFKDINHARNVMADALAQYAGGVGTEPSGGEAKFSINKDSTADEGNWVETIVMGNKTFVRGKEGTFDAATTAASIAHAKTIFDKVGIPVVSETRPDPRRGGLPITFWRFADFGKDNAAGEKLILEVRREIAESQQGNKPPDVLASLLNSIRVNFEEGTMPMFGEPIRQALFNLSQGFYSWHAAILGAASAHSPDLLNVMRNVDVMLGRARYDSFGGEAYDSFFGRILDKFRSFFTPEEIEAAGKDFPALKQILDRIIAQNYHDYAGRVFRKVQQQWKEKNAPKISKLELDARIQEAAQSIIEEAKKRFGIEVKPPKGKPLSPYEQLLHLVNEKNADKVASLMEGAVSDAEYNAGRRAMEDAVKTETDPAVKQDLIDHLTLMAADHTIQPLPEYVEKGLDLPEYQNWKQVRDDWFDYSPISMKLLQKVIKGDFRGTKFGDGKEKPADTRLDLNALAKQPEAEVARVLDAYYHNVESEIEAAGATDETRQRVAQQIQDEVAKQLEQARTRFRSGMFKEKPAPGTKLTAEQALAQELNAGLFRDIRLDMPSMVERVSEKSRVQNLLPKTADVVKQILNTPAFRQSDIQENFVNHLIDKLGVPEDQAQNAWKVFSKAFESRFALARERALAAARSKLMPVEQKELPRDNPFWHKVEQFVNAGGMDSSEFLTQIAKERHGWIPPTPDQIRLIKQWVEAEQRLRTLPKAIESQIRLSFPEMPEDEMAAYLEGKRKELEYSTVERRAYYLRRLGVEWTRMTRPINFLKYFDSRYRRNNAQALNEYETLDMLMKVGFGAFRLPTHIATQLVVHTATRAVGSALEIRDSEIAAGKKRGAVDRQFWSDVHTALGDSRKSTLASLKAAAISARAEILGRGETRNMDRIMSGINALERLSAWADRQAAAGRPWLAVIGHIINLPRVVQWYVSAIDHFQGKPAEYQEVMRQIEMKMREDGRSRAEIEANKDEILGLMRSEFTRAVADTKAMFDSVGEHVSERQIEEGAQNLVRRRIYDRMRQMGLPADAFEEDNNILKSTIAWQESVAHGLGGVLATGLRGIAKAGEFAGIPTSMTRLSNAIGTGINYSLMNTPFYKLAAFKIPGISRGESPWFRSSLDRNHRMVQALAGTALGATMLGLALAGYATVNLMGPKDKKERDRWIAQGHKPGTVEFNLPDGTFIPISLSVGPMSLYAPYLSTGGAIHDLYSRRHAEQEKLNAEAAKKGLPPGKIAPVSSLDALMVAGSALAGSIMSSRTASGLTASVTEQGIPNAQKLAASFVSPLIPALPALQEISRMMGVQMDPKTASVWDYMVPLPTSPHRSVNVLGEPVETPDDIQRVIQVITAGSYPAPVDPQALKSQTGYNALFASGYTPGSINPAKGYDVGGTFRPLTDSELQQYTIARGQMFKDALQGLGPNPTHKEVQQAYQQANNAALQAAGVTLPQKGVRTTVAPAQRPAAGHAARGGIRLGTGRRHALLPRLHKIGHTAATHHRTSALLRGHRRKNALLG